MTAPGGWELVTEVDEQNPVLGDLRIRGARLAKLASVGDAVRQAVQVELRWWLSEWFLDARRGMPYLEQIFRRGVSEATVRAIIRRRLLRIDGVASVPRLVVTIDRSTRRGTVEGEVVTVEGEPVQLGSTPIGAR